MPKFDISRKRVKVDLKNLRERIQKFFTIGKVKSFQVYPMRMRLIQSLGGVLRKYAQNR